MTSRVILILIALLLTGTASAQSVSEVQVGHWARAKGQFDSAGRFQVSELEIREPEDYESILATVEDELTSTRFLVHGQEVHTSVRTKFRDVSPSNLVGSRVKIEGRWRGARKFSSRTISKRDPGRDRIEGRVDSIRQQPDGTWHIEIMSFELRAAADLKLEQETPLAQFELIVPRVIISDDPSERRDDDDDLPGTIRLADNVTFGGQLEWRSGKEGNYNLNDNNAEDRTDHQPSIRGEVVYQAREDLLFLGGFRQSWLFRDDEDRPKRNDATTTLTEAYGYWRNVRGSGLDLQFGRQDFDEQREWLYDQNLDAIRVIADRSNWRAELSISTTLSSGSRVDESSRNLIAYVSNNDSKRHLAAYWIDRNDRSDSGGHPSHLGVRALGEWVEDHHSWAEFAVLRGETGGRGNSGFGFDLGTTWAPNGKDHWNYTAGYALGSGDAATTGTNGNFAQTGLQDNNGRLLGVTSFRYYGELVDPELSNLSILTLGIGRRFAEKNSIDFLLHKYDQVDAAGFLLDTDIDRNPDGIHKELGWEFDIVFGSRAYENWNFEIVLGAFFAGRAFPGADDAWLARFQARYLF